MPTALLAEFYAEMDDSCWDYEPEAYCEVDPKDVDLSLSETEVEELYWRNWIGCKADGIECFGHWVAQVEARREKEVTA